MAQDFTLDHFRRQLDQVRELGTAEPLARLPGLSEVVAGEADPGAAVRRALRIIDAMTAEERADPDLIDDGRRSRIAAGSDTRPADVDRLLAQFGRLRELTRWMAGLSVWQRITTATGFGPPPEPDGGAEPGAAPDRGGSS